MRAPACVAVAAIALAAGLAGAPLAFAQDAPPAALFWKAVQGRCDASAAKPAGALGRRIAKIAIDEFIAFGGHAIDSNGRLFHFGQTEGEHVEENGNHRPPRFGDFGWWRVMKYWRALYGKDKRSAGKRRAGR